jgi:glycosyltransferase involved in cell wall biosynthesis
VLVTGNALIPEYPGLADCGERLHVYYPPVDTEAFKLSPSLRRETRQELGIPDDAPVIGTVANLNPQKGIEYFVRAAARVHVSRPECRFLLVGAEYATHRDYAASVHAEMARSGVPADRFVLTGGREDVERLYPAMDVKLITSVPRSEGAPTTALEAMACGVPVVATDVGAVSEVVEDGVTGFVVPPLDPDAIAKASLRLLADAELSHRFGETARERAVTLYDVRICAEGRARAFRAAIEHHRARGAARTPVASAR